MVISFELLSVVAVLTQLWAEFGYLPSKRFIRVRSYLRVLFFTIVYSNLTGHEFSDKAYLYILIFFVFYISNLLVSFIWPEKENLQFYKKIEKEEAKANSFIPKTVYSLVTVLLQPLIVIFSCYIIVKTLYSYWCSL